MTETSFAKEDFGALLEESLSKFDFKEGTVVKGTIMGFEKDFVVVDVGLKVEGRIPLREFGLQVQDHNLQIGDTVEVYLERVENVLGEAVLSRDKARREESWIQLEKAYASNEKVTGQIFSQVKGGFTVDIDGVGAFLPRSQVDIRPVHDLHPLMNSPQPFHILKMDKRRGNIVVSRRMVLEETRAVQRSELVQSLEEGQIVEGVVKNITDYGAFIDLGGLDGLLHVTDIAWRRITHPSEILNISDIVKVQVIRVNQETQRISLGMKQLEADPWTEIDTKYPLGKKCTGRITNIADYGAFVELTDGIEGLIHVSEMSWTKKNVHPSKIVSTSQEVEVVVLDIDSTKRRISLGLKQTLRNPWEIFAESFKVGAKVEGAIRNKTEFGLFIGLENDIDGLIHLTDLDWNRPGEEAIEEYKKGQVVQAVILDIDTKKERIALGIKQLQGDPIDTIGKRGSVATCEVIDVKEGGLEVKLVGTEITAFLRRSELSRDRNEQRPDRFAIGDKFDAKITQLDKKARKVNVSIKALEVAEEKEAIAQYGSTDAGASLGDILGAALKAKDGDDKTEKEKVTAKSEKKLTKSSSQEKKSKVDKAGKEDEPVKKRQTKASKEDSESVSKSKAKSDDSGKSKAETTEIEALESNSTSIEEPSKDAKDEDPGKSATVEDDVK